MDRNFNREIAHMMSLFGVFLETVTVPPIDLAALSETAPPPELANKLNALLADQKGTLPEPLRLACENWVDAWFGAIVIAQNAERNPDAAVRQASLATYSYLLGQMMALQELFDAWGENGTDIVVLE